MIRIERVDATITSRIVSEHWMCLCMRHGSTATALNTACCYGALRGHSPGARGHTKPNASKLKRCLSKLLRVHPDFAGRRQFIAVVRASNTKFSMIELRR
jgi:hypothetical protein